MCNGLNRLFKLFNWFYIHGSRLYIAHITRYSTRFLYVVSKIQEGKTLTSFISIWRKTRHGSLQTMRRLVKGNEFWIVESHRYSCFFPGHCQDTPKTPLKCYECSNLMDPKCGLTWGYDENSEQANGYLKDCSTKAVACQKMEYKDSLQGKETGETSLCADNGTFNLIMMITVVVYS